jgi:hypothetical protein
MCMFIFSLAANINYGIILSKFNGLVNCNFLYRHAANHLLYLKRR